MQSKLTMAHIRGSAKNLLMWAFVLSPSMTASAITKGYYSSHRNLRKAAV